MVAGALAYRYCWRPAVPGGAGTGVPVGGEVPLPEAWSGHALRGRAP
jgi:hypothetical protein